MKEIPFDENPAKPWHMAIDKESVWANFALGEGKAIREITPEKLQAAFTKFHEENFSANLVKVVIQS